MLEIEKPEVRRPALENELRGYEQRLEGATDDETKKRLKARVQGVKDALDALGKRGKRESTEGESTPRRTGSRSRTTNDK